MPNLKNQAQTKDITAALAESKAVIIANYAGLDVASQTELRRLISESGGKFAVAKNTLLKIALTEKLGTLSDDASKALEGPTAVLYANDDAVVPTKALVKFVEGHDLPEIKIGFLDGQVLTKQDILNLAKLPGKQELLGMLVGQLNAPISSFAQVLRANLQGLVYVVDAIKNSKQ